MCLCVWLFMCVGHLITDRDLNFSSESVCLCVCVSVSVGVWVYVSVCDCASVGLCGSHFIYVTGS